MSYGQLNSHKYFSLNLLQSYLGLTQGILVEKTSVFIAIKIYQFIIPYCLYLYWIQI